MVSLTTVEARERPNRVTKLVSGDDLEDDFVSLTPLNEKDKDGKTKKKQGLEGEGKEKDAKTKKKQGPKVVNFVA